MQFPVQFRDGTGTLQGEGRIKGNWLYLTIDGIRFDGQSLDSLVPRPKDQPGISRFTLGSGMLAECQLIAEYPTRVLVGEEEKLAILVAAVTIGSVDLSGWEDPDFFVAMGMTLDGVNIQSPGNSDSFEEELIVLQSRLPAGNRLTNCFFCAFSDYHPHGEHESSGTLACFRDVQQAYLSVLSREDLATLWDQRTELVQEIDLCNSFQIRTEGHGCRSLEPPTKS